MTAVISFPNIVGNVHIWIKAAKSLFSVARIVTLSSLIVLKKILIFCHVIQFSPKISLTYQKLKEAP